MTRWRCIANSNHAGYNREIATSVGNGLWGVPLSDPYGYRIEFSSSTDAPEESELEE
jgi:hypothetical protein